MRELQIMGKDARLSEKTVQKATKAKPRRKSTTSKRDNYSRAVSKLDLRIHDPAVSKTARSLAGGDIRRIEQVAVNDLIVHNSPDWRKQK